MAFLFGSGPTGYHNYEGYDDGYDEMYGTGTFCTGVQNDGAWEGEDVSHGGVTKAKPKSARQCQTMAKDMFKALADATPANFSGGASTPHTLTSREP